MAPSTASSAASERSGPLGDRLVRLAQDADRAGYRIAAEHLAYLASKMLGAPDDLRA